MTIIKKSKKNQNNFESGIDVGSFYNPGENSFGVAHLTEAEPTSDWFSVSGGDGIAYFSLLSKLEDGSNAVLSGNIKIQCIMGQKYREYAICDIIKNTSDLATVFYFTSAHMGKSGIECGMPKNCLMRLKLEPNTGDDVIVEWVC